MFVQILAVSERRGACSMPASDKNKFGLKLDATAVEAKSGHWW